MRSRPSCSPTAIRALSLAIGATSAMFSVVQGAQHEPLRAEMARIAAAAKGVTGVAAIDLSTGVAVEHNGDQRFKMASTFKLPLAVFAMHVGESGRVSLTEAVPVAREDMIEPGILNEYFRHPGVALSTLNAIELSIARSDNGATDIIYNRVGGPAAANAWLRARGYADMHLGSRTVRQTFAGADVPEGEAAVPPSLDRTVTPRAMVRFLADLYEGRLLNEQSTATILDIMSRTVGERIALHLPRDVTVLHKTGTLFGQEGLSVNDVGYMRTPDGRTIAIAVFIKESPPEAVAHSTRDDVIGHISRGVYDYFQLRQ